MATVPGTDLLTVAEFLSGRRLFGAVWTDEHLCAQQRFGALVAHIPIGEPLTHSVLALLGLEDQIEALQAHPASSVDLRNVQLDPVRRQGERINIQLYWLSGERRYLLLLTPAPSNDDIEVILSAQVRARAIAEADATEKSRQLAKVNDDLSRANQDLQAYASVVSHDLNSPLRKLRYFARAASGAIDGSDPGTALAHLQAIEGQAIRMSAMLSGLLDYSRIGQKTTIAEPVNTGELVSEIVASIPRPDGLQIATHGDWPTFETLRQPLDIVMRNLIDNAVKHHDTLEGRIVVAGRDCGSVWHVSIADDGPGISSEWHNAIFEPFTRIADENDGPPGSGMGLALVKRTVDTYGGQIAVHSDPRERRGTTFLVHWPKIVTD